MRLEQFKIDCYEKNLIKMRQKEENERIQKLMQISSIITNFRVEDVVKDSNEYLEYKK